MGRQGPYPWELRERAIRMVQDHRHEYASGWQATQSLAPKFGVHPMTLHEWVKRAEIEPGQYLSIRYTERLAEAGINASVGSLATRTTTPLRSRSTACTRVSSSTSAARGPGSSTSSTPPLTTWSGSTTVACIA